MYNNIDYKIQSIIEMDKNLRMKRLFKEQQQLIKEPIPNILVKRDGQLNFHFVIYNLDGDYRGGFYHGVLQLHENYPFAAPKLIFYTPNGRFQLNIPICTSFTNYHQESWTAAWNIRSLILGTLSFMTSDQGSYGCRADPPSLKRKMARDSINSNLKNAKFCQLFKQQVEQILKDRGMKDQYSQGQSHSQALSKQSEEINEEQQKEKVPIERQLLLQQILHNKEQDQKKMRQRSRIKRKKIIIGCGIGIIAIVVTCIIILK